MTVSDWQTELAAEQNQPYFQQLMQRVERERTEGKVIFPPADAVFNAFDSTPFEQVKVVIIGQDPYHGSGQAHGLSFSVKNGVKIPPSLRNIFKELETDIAGFSTPTHGNLQGWAQQGVLLLNTVLTVEQGKAHSHARYGWEDFTAHVIQRLSQHRQNLVFMLWGSHAQKKGQIIDQKKHHILTAPHPSPLSAHRGFLGCQHFSKTNRLLLAQGDTPVDWSLA
ncbi:uracil-DNA glycosylase [Aliiglaciecola sp. LCG003]|uniref:uracil-DNA glycosylase n=1 Tax=Aliiglaciecola sp. LCG003 TaxID=3053655 RepID=UPI00257350A8|nr:uracil-DNA glycosylase [Aliiglaciecola sp. LCG003]WJG11324.1 uracil-DNA glycosylase [Aliiglaciecola sp. LCG003]